MRSRCYASCANPNPQPKPNPKPKPNPNPNPDQVEHDTFHHNVPQFLQQQGELVPLLKDEMLRVLRIAEETEAAELSAG